MDTTPNLALPYILASQAQKHVMHNEAIRALDALVQISVKDRDLAAPPGAPAEGDRYIVAAAATGAWSGHDGEVAAWQDAAWMFYAPAEGWIAWVADEDALLAFDGADWVTAAAAAALQNVPMLGVNATADTTNRLALASRCKPFRSRRRRPPAEDQQGRGGRYGESALPEQCFREGRARSRRRRRLPRQGQRRRQCVARGHGRRKEHRQNWIGNAFTDQPRHRLGECGIAAAPLQREH